MKVKIIFTEPQRSDAERIVSNRFFTIHGVKRQTPNAFTEFVKARDNLRDELYNMFKIPQLVEWLNKRFENSKIFN